MARESLGLCGAGSGGTSIALARVKTWNPGDTLTAADLNAEFNNILNNPTSLINLSAAGDVCVVSSAAAVTRLAIGTAGQALSVSTGLLPVWQAPLLQSYLAGCQITAVNSSSTGTTVSASSGSLTFSSGIAVDSGNTTPMVLAAITGTTTGSWVVGSSQPKMDTLSASSTFNLASTTWYHVYVISSAIGGSVDVYYSTSTAPTLPTGYTKSRRIASFYATTSGSGSTGVGIRLFTQDGDYFRWNLSSPDVNVVSPSTSAQTQTLLVPTGLSVQALFNGAFAQGVSGGGVIFSDLSVSDETPGATLGSAPFASIHVNSGSNNQSNGQFLTRTNASGQIRYHVGVSSTGTLGISTLGWFDQRGRTV